MKKFKAGNVISHIYLIILTLISIFPLVWIIISSLKGKGELTGNPTAFWPETWTFDYYAHVINDLKFFVNIRNSVIISLVTTLIAITVAALAAYGIVRFFKRLGSAMSKVLVTTYIFPPILLAIPYSVVMGKLGLINTRIGLVIVYLSFSVPYAVWLLTGFFRTVPLEIEEAARIDGAGELKIYSQIVFPMCKPGLATLVVFTFNFMWNDYMAPMIYLTSDKLRTIQIGLASFRTQYGSEYGLIMAGTVCALIPMLLIFIVGQKYLVEGIAFSGLKG